MEQTGTFLNPYNPQEQEIRRSEVGIKPVSASEVLKAGMSNALDDLPTSNVMYYLYDKGQLDVDVEKIRAEHPDVPKEVFSKNMSHFKANVLADRWRGENDYNVLKRYRDPMMGWLYDMASSTPKMLDPINVAGIVAGNIFAPMALNAAGIAASKGFTTLLAENLIGAVGSNYTAAKYTQDFTEKNYTLADAFTESLGGSLLFAGLGHLWNNVKLKSPKDIRMSKDIFGGPDGNSGTSPETIASMKTQLADALEKSSKAESLSENIKNNAYNYKSGNIDLNPLGTAYGLKNTDAHLAPTSKLDGTVSFVSTKDALEGTSLATGKKGDIVSVDVEGLNLIHEDGIVDKINNSEKFKHITSEKIESLDDLSKDQMTKLSKELSSYGYDGIVRDVDASVRAVSHEYDPKVFSIFEDSLQKLTQKEAGSLNPIPENGYTYTGKAGSIAESLSEVSTDALDAKGKLSSGEEIDLNASGYFKSDVSKTAHEVEAFKDVYSEETLNRITRAQENSGVKEGQVKYFENTLEKLKKAMDKVKQAEAIDDVTIMNEDIKKQAGRIKELRNKLETMQERIKKIDPKKAEQLAEMYSECIK